MVTGWQQWWWSTAASASREVVAGAGRGEQTKQKQRRGKRDDRTVATAGTSELEGSGGNVGRLDWAVTEGPAPTAGEDSG